MKLSYRDEQPSVFTIGNKFVLRVAFVFTSLSIAILMASLGGLFLSMTEVPFYPKKMKLQQISVSFQPCAGTTLGNCVVDGDTIWMAGEKIRLSDIDTPEVFSPKCDAELALGKRASKRLVELLNSGPIALVQIGGRDRDRYGRQLRVVQRDGVSLGDALIDEGLARPWDGARRAWCA